MQEIISEISVALKQAGVRELSVLPSSNVGNIDAEIVHLINQHDLEDPFYVLDVGELIRLHQTWTRLLPRVRPFYAVKCSPSPVLLAVLAALDAGFDCASKAEIAQVCSLGVNPSRIIYANPCKMPSHLSYASSTGVSLTTFDSADELHKVHHLSPSMRLLLRLRTDDKGARCPLGVKYGALRSEIPSLLETAQALGLHVIGISFHVGSGGGDPSAYMDAIKSARDAFDWAERAGMERMSLLDIGGGLTSGPTFTAAAAVINAAIAVYFPSGCNVDIIAEPGRYFAESPSTLATRVFGLRVRGDHREYWINDGLYGSMNCVLFDHATLASRPLLMPNPMTASECEREDPTTTPLACSTVFGPTCDGLDIVLRDALLPKMRVGDWMVFPKMGAYTAAAGSSFNGFATSAIPTYYVLSKSEGADATVGGATGATGAVEKLGGGLWRVESETICESEGELSSHGSGVFHPDEQEDDVMVCAC